MNTIFESIMYLLIFLVLLLAFFILYKECKNNYKYVTLKEKKISVTYLNDDNLSQQTNHDFVM